MYMKCTVQQWAMWFSKYGFKIAKGHNLVQTASLELLVAFCERVMGSVGRGGVGVGGAGRRKWAWVSSHTMLCSAKMHTCSALTEVDLLCRIAHFCVLQSYTFALQNHIRPWSAKLHLHIYYAKSQMYAKLHICSADICKPSTKLHIFCSIEKDMHDSADLCKQKKTSPTISNFAWSFDFRAWNDEFKCLKYFWFWFTKSFNLPGEENLLFADLHISAHTDMHIFFCEEFHIFFHMLTWYFDMLSCTFFWKVWPFAQKDRGVRS